MTGDHINKRYTRYYARFVMYSMVIGMSFIVPEPMNVIQAAIGGMALGAYLVMFSIDRKVL